MNIIPLSLKYSSLGMFVKKNNLFSYLNIVFLCEGSGVFIKIKIEMKQQMDEDKTR